MTSKQAAHKRYYEKQKLLHPNLCKSCGKNDVSGTGYKTCAECRARRRNYFKRTKEEKKKEKCDMNCLMCGFADCINGNAPITRGEKKIAKEFMPEKGEIVPTVAMLYGK